MTGARITCPRCGLSLSVSDRAPRYISCPRCLAPLQNPSSIARGTPVVATVPVPVLPLDERVQRDTRVGKWLLVALMGLLGVAALMTIGYGDTRAAFFVLLLIGGLATLVFFVTGMRPAPPKATAPSSDLPPPLPTADGRSVLEYGGHTGRRPVTVAAVAAGFFSAVGVCAAGLIILALSAGSTGSSGHNYNALILAAVVVVVVLFIVSTNRTSRRWPGYGPGATAGLVLGLMALGPCAACYLMTLG